VLLCGAFALYYPLVVAKEEAFLSHKFGEPYDRYRQEVPRWLPRLSQWHEPEHVDAMPRFIRRTMCDAAVFFLPLPCFLLIRFLQAQLVLPTWLTLP
jgi:hypothetical protein